MLERLKSGKNLPLFTSCCPGWVKFCENRYPEFRENISTCRSPQAMFGALLKEEARMKAAEAEKEGRSLRKTVVISIMPCTAKKAEVQQEHVRPYVDACITFEELQALFDSRDLDITELEENYLDNASYFGRIYARCGGLADAVQQGLKEHGYEVFELKAQSCDGIEQCRAALLRKSKNLSDVNFIEGMACIGGCIGGAGCLTHGEKNKAEVDKYGREAYEKTITDAISDLK